MVDHRTDPNRQKCKKRKCQRFRMTRIPFQNTLQNSRTSGQNRTIFQKTRQILRKLTSCRVSVYRHFGETLQQDRLQIMRDLRLPSSRTFGLFLRDLIQKLDLIRFGKNRIQRQNFVKSGSQRVNIHPMICQTRISLCLFWAHVPRSPYDFTCLRQLHVRPDLC